MTNQNYLPIFGGLQNKEGYALAVKMYAEFDYQLFKPSNLRYQYSTTTQPGDDPTKRHHPDSDLLDRQSASEMVTFINHILKTWKWVEPLIPDIAVATGRLIERLIKEQVPKDYHSKSKSIEPWLRENYNKFRNL